MNKNSANVLMKKEVLTNGAIVIKHKGDYVLAMWEHCGCAIEFVTWYMDKNRDTFYGRYFANIDDALKDLNKRGA